MQTINFPIFILLVIANIYGCFLIHRSKHLIVNTIIGKLDCVPGSLSRKRDQLQKRLNTRLLLSDLAEFSFGPLGCLIIDCSLVFLQLNWLTFTAPIVATSISVVRPPMHCLSLVFIPLRSIWKHYEFVHNISISLCYPDKNLKDQRYVACHKIPII